MALSPVEALAGSSKPSPAALPSTSTTAPSAVEALAKGSPLAAQGPQTTPRPTPPGVEDSPGNPFEFIAGMAGNLISDIPEFASGLGHLVGSAAHDIAGGVTQLIPGEQGGLERDIQQHGYQTAELAKNLVGWGDRPSALLQDYGDRYGVHGFNTMMDEIYSNPLSYILDAVMVADAGASAATGAENVLNRIAAGSRVADMATTAAETLRGGVTADALDAMRYFKIKPKAETVVGQVFHAVPEATSPIGSVVEKLAANATGTGVDAAKNLTSISTSLNPLKRFAQNFIIDKVLTTSAEDAAARLAAGEGFRGLTSGTINEAAARLKTLEEGTRVLRPWSEKLLGATAAKKLFGMSSQAYYAARDASYIELRDVFKGLETRLGRELDKGAFVQRLQGIENVDQALAQLDQVRAGLTVPAEGMPAAGKVDLAMPGLKVGEFTGLDINGQRISQMLDETTGQPMVADDVAQVLSNNSDKAHLPSRLENPNPHMPEGYGPHDNAWNRVINSADDVGVEMQRDIDGFNAGVNGKAVHGGVQSAEVLDYFGEGSMNSDLYPGVHVRYHFNDGTIAEVSYATPVTQDVQNILSHIQGHIPMVNDVLSEARYGLAQLSAAAGDEESLGALMAHAASVAQEETRAALMQMKRASEIAFREANNAAGYDPVLQAMDRLHLWEYKWGAKNYVDNFMKDIPDWAVKGIDGPFTTLAKRAFAPLRFEIFHAKMTEFENGITSIFEKYGQQVKSPKGTFYHSGGYFVPENMRATVRAEVRSLMQTLGFPEESADRIVNGYFNLHSLPIPAKQMPGIDSPGWIQSGPRMIANRARRLLYEPMVVNATDPAFTWETFRQAVAQVPEYFPHIKDPKASEFLGKADILAKPENVRFSKGWKGELMANGAYLKDPQEVYKRLAAAYLRHQEAVDLINKVIPLGREMSETEVMQRLADKARGMDVSGEVMWSPDAIKTKLNIQHTMMDDIVRNMNTGLSYEDAASQALQNINEMIQNGTLESLKGAKVYAIPKHVADATSAHFRMNFAPGAMRLFYDGPMNLWRATVLGINPRWMFYNEMGNVIFTGVKNTPALKRIFGTLSDNNSKFLQTVLREADKGEDLSSMVRAGLYHTTENTIDRNWGVAATNYPGWTKFADTMVEKNPFSRVTRGIRSANSAMEGTARFGVSADEYAKLAFGWKRIFKSQGDIARDIARNGLSPETANAMIAAANRTLGDYLTLGPFERQVVRRFFIPFYPFYRHIVKFALKMPWENPLKSQLFRLIDQTDQDMANELPDYLQGSVYLGQLGGLNAYWNVQNFNPLNNFTQARAGVLGAINPFLKAGLQSQFGVNDFNEPFEDPANVYTAGNGMKFLRTPQGWVPFEGNVHPPFWKMAAEQFGTPVTWFNLPGYKNRTPLTTALGTFGFSVSRFNQQKYQMNALLGEMQALTHGGQ